MPVECDAICPTYGDGCEGCRGLISTPNIKAMREVMAEHGIPEADIEAKLSMFLTNQLTEIEKVG